MGKTNKKDHYRSDLDHSKKSKAEKKEKESNTDDYEPWDDIDDSDEESVLDAYRDSNSESTDY